MDWVVGRQFRVNLFSFASIFLLPAAMLLLLVESHLGSEELRMKPSQAAAWALYWAVASGLLCALTYFTFLVPNWDENLKQFWSPCYLLPGDSGAFFSVVYKNLSSVLAQGLDSPFSDEMFARFSTGSYLLTLLLPIAAFLALQGRGKARLPLACVTVVPLAAALMASMLSLYPLCEVHFAQALLPCVLLMHALALGLVPNWPALRRAGSMLLALLALGLAISSTQARIWPPRVQTSFEDAFRFLRSQPQLAEPLFVHGALQEQFKFYSRSSPERRQNALQSITNPACCPRGMEYSKNYMDATTFRDEFGRMLARAGSGHFWLLYAEQAPAMKIPWRETPMHLRSFGELGCKKGPNRPFRDLSVYRFTCPADAISRFSAMAWPPEPHREEGGF